MRYLLELLWWQTTKPINATTVVKIAVVFPQEAY